jgi:hypothetical protein
MYNIYTPTYNHYSSNGSYARYLLGIMSKEDNFNNLSWVIHDISSLVYNEVDAQYQNSTADFELAE